MRESVTHIRGATRYDAAGLARLGARDGRFGRGRALVAEDGRESSRRST